MLLGIRKIRNGDPKYKQTNNKKIFLGYFDTPEEASESYLKAKRELHPFWIEEKVI